MTVREYSSQLGDNPCCSYGPPVGMGWNFVDLEAQTMDEFEQRRGTSRRTQRTFARVGRLSPQERLNICVRAGHRPDEIRSRMSEMAVITQRRHATMPNQLLVPFVGITGTLEDWGPVERARDAWKQAAEASGQGLRNARAGARGLWGRLVGPVASAT